MAARIRPPLVRNAAGPRGLLPDVITLTSSVREQGDFVVETDALTKRHGAVLAVDDLSLLEPMPTLGRRQGVYP